MSIKLKNITIDYGNFLAVDDLNISINSGELVSLLGPSGCGKTTALNAIAGLINTTKGQILFDGVDVTHKSSQKRNIGLVFQSYALYTHMSVFKNIAYPLYHSKDFKSELSSDNAKYKSRLKALNDSKGYELIIKQQNDFTNNLKSFLKQINNKISQLEGLFLKEHKDSIVNYVELLFKDKENTTIIKNHLVSYLYDKLKIKFNEISSTMEQVIADNYKAVMLHDLDMRFKNTIKHYASTNLNNLSKNKKHLGELIKTSKTTKKSIIKEEKSLGLELNIFSNASNDLYEQYLIQKNDITENFIDKNITVIADEINDYFTTVIEKIKTPIISGNKIELTLKDIKKNIEQFKKNYISQNLKLINTFIKEQSKTLPKNILLKDQIKIVLESNVLTELNAMEQLMNTTLEAKYLDLLSNSVQTEFSTLTNYYDFKIEEVLNFKNDNDVINKQKENAEKEIKEILKETGIDIFSVENDNYAKYVTEKETLVDSLLSQNVTKIEDMIEDKFLALPNMIEKELEAKSKIIETKELEEEIRKNIYSRKRKIRELVFETAKQVEIENQLNKKPSELSGGQQQRVAIARAIVKKPSILLMDEPLSNLDAKLRLTTREWIKRFQQKVGITTIFVTHDQEEAMSISDSIFVMNKGVLQQSGTPLEIYNKPVNKFVAKFIGTPNVNFINVKINKSKVTLPSNEVLKIKKLDIEKSEWTLGVRPERLTLDKKGGKVHIGSGDVVLVEQLGKQNHIKVRLITGEEVTIILEPHEWNTLKNNSRLDLYARKEDLYLFNDETNLVEVSYE
ncbi:hypothetical protein CG002_00095 [Mesoplasma florum]|uniref:ATP-binding cassette domain-containing protein n=1 Tax=Mesoplasma florum TaxID=2151 RepID=UPI000D0321C0|nr:ATP-binding cassette domain-containing protein [Mesoplasma florum]AVN58640.1 hypothetical protein CG009_00090 [Mesoplasma florum]AVN64774.1 hypothetical protein CG002_00095 [Mesoplasma florum]